MATNNKSGSNNKGATNVGRGTQQKRLGRAAAYVPDWTHVSTDLIGRAIAGVARNVGALRFGYSRDGSSFAIGVYGDGEPYTEFFRTPEECDEFLAAIIEDTNTAES